MSHQGILKIADFGLAREYGSPLKNYTPLVVTLWYRAPELLLGAKQYSTAIDMWSVGCIFAELVTQKALFPAKSEIELLNKILKLLGTPTEQVWQGINDLPLMKSINLMAVPHSSLRKEFSFLTENAFDLLNKMLCYDPKRRISATDALKHDYFKELPSPTPPEYFPHWPAKSEGSKVKREKSPQAPKPGGGLDGENEEADTGGFLFQPAGTGSVIGPSAFSLRF